MNTKAGFILLILFALPGLLTAQEVPAKTLSNEEFEIFTEIPTEWTRISISESGIPVIRKYCDAGTGTVTLQVLDYGNATITFFYGQEAETFDIVSAGKDAGGYWLGIMEYDGTAGSIGFSYLPGSEKYVEWGQPYGGMDGLYVDSSFLHCVDVIEAEGCDEY